MAHVGHLIGTIDHSTITVGAFSQPFCCFKLHLSTFIVPIYYSTRSIRISSLPYNQTLIPTYSPWSTIGTSVSGRQLTRL